MFSRRIRSLVFAVSVLLVAGCGSGIPNVAGDWTFTGTSSNTEGFTRTFGTGTLVQQGGAVAGTLSNAYTLNGSALRGGDVNFTLSGACEAGPATIYLVGKAQSDNSMSGSYEESDACLIDSGSWTAAKK